MHPRWTLRLSVRHNRTGAGTTLRPSGRCLTDPSTVAAKIPSSVAARAADDVAIALWDSLRTTAVSHMRTWREPSRIAKMLVVGSAIVAVFVIANNKVYRSEPTEEASAISALHAVATAQRAYAELNGGYATSLKTLAAKCSGRGYGFISPNLSSDPTVTSRYEIRLHADEDSGHVDCHGNATARAFYAIAVPLQRTGTARRAFAVDQNNVIWYDSSGAAPKPPFSDSSAYKRLQ